MSITLQIFWRGARKGAAEDGEIRAKTGEAAVDRARSGDDAVAREFLVSPSRRNMLTYMSYSSNEPGREGGQALRAVSRLACCARSSFRRPHPRLLAAPFKFFDRGGHGPRYFPVRNAFPLPLGRRVNCGSGENVGMPCPFLLWIPAKAVRTSVPSRT